MDHFHDAFVPFLKFKSSGPFHCYCMGKRATGTMASFAFKISRHTGLKQHEVSKWWQNANFWTNHPFTRLWCAYLCSAVCSVLSSCSWTLDSWHSGSGLQTGSTVPPPAPTPSYKGRLPSPPTSSNPHRTPTPHSTNRAAALTACTNWTAPERRGCVCPLSDDSNNTRSRFGLWRTRFWQGAETVSLWPLIESFNDWKKTGEREKIIN